METEKALEKIRCRIVQKDKRQRQMLQCIDLAIERITTGARIAELAKRHRLSEEKVRRYIDRAIFLARSRMFER
jgi:Mor family transcriptional regulator